MDRWLVFSLSCVQVLPSVVCCQDRYLVDSRERVRPQGNHLLLSSMLRHFSLVRTHVKEKKSDGISSPSCPLSVEISQNVSFAARWHFEWGEKKNKGIFPSLSNPTIATDGEFPLFFINKYFVTRTLKKCVLFNYGQFWQDARKRYRDLNAVFVFCCHQFWRENSRHGQITWRQKLVIRYASPAKLNPCRKLESLGKRMAHLLNRPSPKTTTSTDRDSSCSNPESSTFIRSNPAMQGITGKYAPFISPLTQINFLVVFQMRRSKWIGR